MYDFDVFISELEGKKGGVCENVIEVRGLFKSYYNSSFRLDVLKGLNLSVYRGEVVAVIGESGSGKSTLLNLIGGLDDFSGGDIEVLGFSLKDMDEDELSMFRAISLGFVFQFHHLLPDFTALENVMLPYLNLDFNRVRAKELALYFLEKVNMVDRSGHRPGELSGGEQQRVAIARALINKPSIILADEPTGNLDERNSEEVQRLLWELKSEHNLTVVIVSHNVRIFSKADRVVELSYGCIGGDV